MTEEHAEFALPRAPGQYAAQTPQGALKVRDMKRFSMSGRILAVGASALAIALAGAAWAQEDEADADGIPAVNSAGCGLSFAQSGAASNVAYAALQLRTCDALLAEAASAAELTSAYATINGAHEQLIERWKAVGEELMAAAADPTAPVPPPAPGVPRTVLDAPPAPAPAAVVEDETAEGEEAEAEAAETETEAAEAEAPAADDAWSRTLAERHAVEVAMDGLRLMSRLSYQLAETYAASTSLAAGLQGPAAARVGDVLAARQVCVSAGIPARGNTPATGPSWYAFAGALPAPAVAEGEEPQPSEPIEYEREIGDAVASAGELFLTTDLATAPELGVTGLTSFSARVNCDRTSNWPSQRAPA